jgi:predicted amidohydrolase YtcJ/beta-lactamase class A
MPRLLLLLLAPMLYAQTFTVSRDLTKLADDTVHQAIQQFGTGGLSEDRIALTIIDLNDRRHPVWGSYNGESAFYPASVCKLFYLNAAHGWMQSGKLQETPELDRAIHDMIVSSSNDATQLVVDMLTGTTGGPEMTPAEMLPWLEKRNAVNRFYADLGYHGININQKTFAEDAYGRERQNRGPNLENGNRLTTNATAQLWFAIVTGQAVSPARSRAMMNLLHRDPFTPKADNPDEQALRFMGQSLPTGSQYYSKAGWTSTTRHDSAFIRLPNGAEYIAVVFTKNNSKQEGIIPLVSKLLADFFLKTQPTADTILTNGRFWTGVTASPWAEAVAIRGERIIAVGSRAEIAKLVSPATHTIDLHGKLGLPGFIDNHTHFISGGFQLLTVDLRDARTQAEFRRRIAEHAKKVGPGRWIQGGSWDHENWPGAPLPTKELIDAVTPENPVAVGRLDGHMLLANTLALRRAGITKDTPDPPGGLIVRDAKTGEPTGILKDAASGLVQRVIPEPSGPEYDAALDAALAEAARHGVTSVADITLWNWWPIYQRYREAGKLTVHIYSRTPMAEWERQRDAMARFGPGDEWLHLGGLKAYMDGSLGSTTAYFFQPYNDAPNTVGLMRPDNQPEGKMRDCIVAADAAGLQCSVHAIGDRANNLLLNYFEEAERVNGPRDRRFRIEHAQHLLASDIPRFAKLGVIASMQPYHLIDDGRWAEKRLGPDRLKTTYAFRTLLDTGATLVFGSDWPVAPLDPIRGIYSAVTRRTLDGKNPGGWIADQKISVEEAVRAYTSIGALAEFSEREKGTLEPGKLADIVVLSDDIFRIAPEKIWDVKVALTMTGGIQTFGGI